MVNKQAEVRKKIFTVPPSSGGRRLDYVIGLFADLSRREAREIVESGFVFVNDIRVTFPSRKVEKGDRVEILRTEKRSGVLSEIKIIYEDNSLIVVNKPAGMLTEKIGSEKGIAVLETIASKREAVYPVHRLDRETSGVLIFAKNTAAKNFLMTEFKERRVNKTYIAIVDGMLMRKSGVLKGRIQKTDEYAETHYEVISILRNATMLKLMPRTGRTHQLRLQLFQIGHPIIGDKKYYDIRKVSIFFERQALHSFRINFLHPQTKRWVTFSAPIPADMKGLVRQLSR